MLCACRRWISLTRVDPQPFIVQIGANDHAPGRSVDKKQEVKLGAYREDPVPSAIRRGFRTLLVEPIPQMAERLRERYPKEIWGKNVTIAEAAICENCSETSRTMYSVDMSNRTGNWGTNTSDTRCAAMSGARWVQEIGSFRLSHVLTAGRQIGHMNHRCRLCSEKLGYKLPTNCLQNVVARNLQVTKVPCMCLPGALQGESRVELLMIDTEGFDYQVLSMYPFATAPAVRVIYESTHLSTSQVIAAAELMRSLGYANIAGGLGRVPTVVWHHMSMVARIEEQDT